MEEIIEIAIADDKKQYRQGVLSLLEEFGIRCISEAENGEELMQFLSSNKKPDVILLDLSMPIMNGDKAYEIISKKHSWAKVIILTDYFEEELIKNFIARGAKGFISKNSSIETLVESIQCVHKYGFYYDNVKHVFRNIDEKELKKANFTKREIEVIRLMSEGNTVKEIADQLFMVEKTVEAHRKNIYQKIKIHSFPKFVAHAIRMGLNFMR